MTQRLFHGGRGGFNVGDVLTPQSEHGFQNLGLDPRSSGFLYAAASFDYAVTYATIFAGRFSRIAAAVYVLKPLGKVEHDPLTLDSGGFRMRSAEIASVALGSLVYSSTTGWKATDVADEYAVRVARRVERLNQAHDDVAAVARWESTMAGLAAIGARVAPCNSRGRS